MIIRHKAADKKERVKAQHKHRIETGMVYEGNRYQVDWNSRVAILSRAIRLMTDPSLDEVTWRTADNVAVTFSKSAFLAFAAKVDEHTEKLQQQSWAEKG